MLTKHLLEKNTTISTLYLQNLLQHITMVTIELQDRLRQMYLSIPERAHYLFTLNDLDRIFRNLLLSLQKDCHHKDLLLLWRHECDWAYGWRMVCFKVAKLMAIQY